MKQGQAHLLVNARQLAFIFDVSGPKISEWTKQPRNPLPVAARNKGRAGNQFDPQVCVEWYVEHEIRVRLGNRRQANEEGDTENVLNFNAEKTRLTKAQADAKELEVRLRMGELIPITGAIAAVTQVCELIDSSLSSIPAQLQRAAPHLTASDVDVVRKVIAKCQNGIANLDFDFTDLASESA